MGMKKCHLNRKERSKIMDLTRDFIKKIEELAAPNIECIHDIQYTDKDLEIIYPPKVCPLSVNSLTGLIDYLESEIDPLVYNKFFIHVKDYKTVQVQSSLQEFNQRSFYIQALAMLPDFDLNRFMSREAFNIMLQSCFKDQGDRAEVLSAISKISIDKNSGIELADNGVSQSVEAVEGTILKTKKTIPNPVRLTPFRPFNEIEQPESNFVLRVNENLQVGLFEADGGAWKREAMLSIKEYLKKELGVNFTIIA